MAQCVHLKRLKYPMYKYDYCNIRIFTESPLYKVFFFSFSSASIKKPIYCVSDFRSLTFFFFSMANLFCYFAYYCRSKHAYIYLDLITRNTIQSLYVFVFFKTFRFKFNAKIQLLFYVFTYIHCSGL